MKLTAVFRKVLEGYIGFVEELHWFQARVMSSSHRWRGMEIEPNLLPRTQSTALRPWVK
ncbi:MAG: hypothetical protein ACLQO6_08770 [Desulfomonilaceae bacterium]